MAGRKNSLSRRGYSAAASLARYGDIRTSIASADAELRDALPVLRAKSRFLSRNSSSMVRFLSLMRTNVVGDQGIRLQSRVKRQSGASDTQLNKKVETLWKKFWHRPTACKVISGRDLLNMCMNSLCTDGEAIWELVRSNKFEHGFAINPVEADILDHELNEIYYSTGNEIRMGVEVDKYGSPVAYWFLTYHPGDFINSFGFQPQKRHRRVLAANVIHIYHKDRPGQTRGEPPAKTVINAVKMLDGYREAEVTGRRIQSSTMGFFTKEMPTNSSAIAELADEAEEAEEASEDLEMEIIPGTFKELPPGYSFEKFDVSGSQNDYKDFEGQVKRDLAMGFGISVFSHGMQTEGVSYSTGRSVLVEDRDMYRCFQQFLIDRAMLPVFHKWVRMISMVSDVIPPSRVEVIEDAVKYRPRGWDWIDPSKEVSANAEALETRQTSYSRVAAARGLDRDELFDEIEDDLQAMADRGIAPKEKVPEMPKMPGLPDPDEE